MPGLKTFWITGTDPIPQVLLLPAETSSSHCAFRSNQMVYSYCFYKLA